MKLKAFLDTNILMDVLQEGRPNRESSQIIFQLVWQQEIEAVITTQSILDVSYMMKNAHVQDRFFAVLEKWCDYINIDQLNAFDICLAARNYTGDFEDDAQYYRALDTCCDVIVTSDEEFRNKYNGKNGHLKLMSPREFVDRMSGNAIPS